MQNILIIINAPAYGNERMLSALRLATAIVAQEADAVVRIFMMSDAVTVGLPKQLVPDLGGGSMQSMLEQLVDRGVQIRLCRTCALARGIADLPLIPGVQIGTLPELAAWTLDAAKVISF